MAKVVFWGWGGVCASGTYCQFFTPLSATSLIQYSLIGVETLEAYIYWGGGASLLQFILLTLGLYSHLLVVFDL